MAVSRRSSRSRYTLVLLVLTSITLLTLDFRGFGPIESARSSVLSFFAPVGDFASGIFSPIGDTWNGAFESGDLQAQNEDLQRQIEELQGKVTEAEAATAELEALKAQENLPFKGESDDVRAEVVSGPMSNFDDSVQINKGSSSGIQVGMPVVSGSGLIGSVETVSDDRATVKLITDPSFQVGVTVAGAPGKGIVEGQDDETRLSASQFATSTEIADGDILQTSGGDRSSFPPGIPVGTVTSVATDDTTQQKTADVRLLANMNDLKYVTVLLFDNGGDE